MKLEVGKKYELNNGEVHECTRMDGDDPLAVDCCGTVKMEELKND